MDKGPVAEQVDSLRVDEPAEPAQPEPAEPAEPALPRLAAAWARLQDHVTASFQSGVSKCGTAVSHNTAVVVNEIDTRAIMCSHVAVDSAEYVSTQVDATKSQIVDTHEQVVRRVNENKEAVEAQLAMARAETMRKVEETQASITETRERAQGKVRDITVMCMPPAAEEVEADVVQPDGDQPMLTEDQVQQLREAFSVFDKSGDGKVTASELGMVMEECGEVVSEAEIKEMIKDVDKSADGTIDFEEFKAIMARMATEEAGLPLSKRIAKSAARAPLKMKAQWKPSLRHADRTVERVKEEAARTAAEKVREAEASVNTAVEKTKQVAIDAKQSTVGWLDSALASVIERFVPAPPPKAPPPPPNMSLGTVGDMDDTQNA